MNARTDIEGVRIPPHSLEAEYSVLGGILLDGSAIERVGALRPEHFYTNQHRIIFQAMLDEAEAGVIDLTTISVRMGERGFDSGILVHLAKLVGLTPSAANVKRYADIVRERHTERALLAALADIGEEAYGHKSARDKLDFAQAKIMAITEGSGRDPMRLGDAEGAYVAELGRRAQHGGGGLPTGFCDLDHKLGGGMRPGELIVVAGRPSMGKSALAFQFAESAARAGNLTLGFSMEMSTQELQDRAVSGVSRIPLEELRTGERAADPYVSDALATIRKWPLFIDDSPALSVHEIRSKARAVKRRHGLALVVVDYLQLMAGDGENRNAQISGISAGLKALAKELAVPVVALSALNRSTENRVDRRPQLSDLRDSGAIEQDADVVVFVHREEQNKPNSFEWRGLGELLLRKNRQGQCGDVRMTWLGAFARFENFGGDGWPVARSGAGKRNAFPEDD
jgi:replicative DNA helicase